MDLWHLVRVWVVHVSEKIGHGQTLNDENRKEGGGQEIDCGKKNICGSIDGFEGAFTDMADNADKADKADTRDER